jgi:hypothetical protein
MNKILGAALAGAIVVSSLLAVFSWQQRRQLQQARARTHEIERAWREAMAEKEQVAQRAQAAESRAERLQREIGEYSAVTSQLRASETAQRSNVTALAQRLNSPTGSNGPAGAGTGVSGKEMGQMLSKMMEDPEMRKMVRTQQKAMVDMMYGGLFKQLKLSPEEQTAFTEELLDTQMRQMENMRGLFGDEGPGESDAQRKEAAKQAKTESDARIRELLGEERFAEYTDYQKNVGERMQLNQLQSRLETSNLQMQDGQMTQLMRLMQEERDRVPSIFPTGPDANPADFKSLTPEKMDQQIAWMEDYNRRVLERAGTVLTPEQLQVYRDFQDQQASMQKIGLKMAAGMFGNAKGDAPGPAAVPK